MSNVFAVIRARAKGVFAEDFGGFLHAENINYFHHIVPVAVSRDFCGEFTQLSL